MKHRILAAMICVCAALTSLCVPALADDTEAETPVPVEATPAPAETTPAPAETTPAPAETTPAPAETTPAPVGEPVEETTAQPLGAANVPSVRANWNDPKINGTFLEVGTYYKTIRRITAAFPKQRRMITISVLTARRCFCETPILRERGISRWAPLYSRSLSRLL